MCVIGYHNCPECGEEIKCYQPDYECEQANQIAWLCEKCEYWIEELRKEEERQADRRRQLEEEYGI